ncbi:2-oxoglutarate dehydrogenase, E2 component, dihydrolipoamide succinyltransferase [Occallatibacter riparius]|uniref:Dihydrolipoamide acetyltransferase component of pyruvate dehydrogenase complex n=1 Tax=Occallatibacter riparius TaxID=1002689 RepID=A0A9J7BTF3_9BACT|nr:2-oxoglutarate dehydrogenase, E2 component, dihydrolipoamide succinyltransferase [Occallatibacter riparius]UWZ85873.1 2-oxoglutarate dehydrogenase, E2 component, dihydrolipoamide succinyltransferase [Occallatibacter riparius]
MPTDVVMPQMGESIFEGTITKWLKKPGDAVQKDEPLFEISTDKVDAEIPAPVSGVLSEIRAQEGETVEVNKVVAVIGGDAPAVRPTAPASPEAAVQHEAAELSGGGTDVVMPQMGESIFEGTITKWRKKAGEMVQKDEPLFEISTDKVDAEIAAPVSGVLREIRVAEGETVVVNTVVAVIGGTAAVAQPDGAPARAANAQLEARAEAAPSPAAMRGPAADATPEPELLSESVRSSPLVRRMAREHNLDLRRIRGTGTNGRITKEDVLAYLKDGAGTAPTAAKIPAAPATVTPAAVVAPGSERVAAPQEPLEGRLEPMSRMRSIIAQRMVESAQTIPHAYMMYKIDMTRVARVRERERAEFEKRHGVKLTYMPFIAAAVTEAIRKYPIVNAKIEGSSIRYHDHVQLGIAVALEWGLIVPVVREAERRGFPEMAATMADLAERARTKKLKPEEASGSTFTLTNFGVFGGDFGTPIINPGESAILAIGALRKEPVVLSDAEGNDTIAIRSMQQFCLGFDHRLIDGADAGRFMMAFRDALEKWSGEIG